MNRRNFMKAGLAVPVLGVAERATAATGPTSPVRISINGLSATSPEIKSYSAAVDLLKKLPNSDPRNWTNLASVHNDFCPHGNWWFLPWHRAYLHYFELTCQDVLKDPTFRLPYWDWTRYPRIPGPFLDSQSPLWDGTRDENGNIELGTETVGLNVIQNIVGAGNWSDVFSGATTSDQQRQGAATGSLEGTPHNGVHSIIGGDMGNFMSPLDPIFWLHHCNVDRIWVSWARNPNHTPPPDSLWQNHKLDQFYDPIARKQVSPVVETTIDAARYGAVYDHYETVPAAGPFLTRALLDSLSSGMTGSGASKHFRRFSIDADDKPSSGSVAEFAAVMNSDFSSLIQGATRPAASGPRNAAVSLVMENIPQPPASTTGLRVFLNCKNPSLNTPLDDPTYVGTLAFFGAHHGADHGSGVTYSLDVSRTLSRTIRAGIYTPQTPVEVSLVPVDLRNPTKPPEGGVIKAQKVRLVGLAPA